MLGAIPLYYADIDPPEHFPSKRTLLIWVNLKTDRSFEYPNIFDDGIEWSWTKTSMILTLNEMELTKVKEMRSIMGLSDS
jgi:hypothetical protein